MAQDDNIYYTRGLEVPETPEPGAKPKFWEKTAVVGKPTPRVDGYERLSGTAVYPSDIKLPNMIYGALLRCPHPNARIKKLDAGRARKMPGVRAVMTGDSAEAKNLKWRYDDFTVPLLDPHCRFEGEAVAAVAADTPYQARDALAEIHVEYEVLPHLADHDRAMDENAPKVHKTGNLVGKDEYSRGDSEKGFARADTVVERTYHTQCELHTPMELHGCVANWEGDRLTIWESSQGVYAVQSTIAEVLDLPFSRVRVIGHYMGGGFGSKLQPGKYTVLAALLARQAARPVKMILTREETYLSVGNRPASTMHLKAGIKNDGTLTALDFRCTGPSGAYPAGGTSLVDWLIRDLYQCDNVSCRSNDVYINAGPARPFRAPGHPQGSWALEQMIDELAEKTGMDPVDLRLKNIPEVSQARGGMPYTTTGLARCIREGAEKFGWKDAVKKARQHNQSNSHVKRGAGMAACLWIVGGGGQPSTVVIKLFRDGSVNLNMGASDIGTGTKTIMALVAAEELGVKPEMIQIEHADTGTTQYATPSGGSKTVPTEAPTVRNAAVEVKRRVLEMASVDLGVPAEDLDYNGAEIVSRSDKDKRIRVTEVSRLKKRGVVVGVGYRGPNPSGKTVNPFGAQFCELEVNQKTGEIRILRFLAAHDSGRVMNRLTYDNQVFGGIVMGIGFGLTEFRQLDTRQTGKLCNRNWHDYKLPTALDVPADMESLPIEIDDPEANNTGAKGLGEPVTIPTAPAIANALYMATGIRFTRAPVTPLEVRRHLDLQKEG
ncbi:MAG: xanthine dehydrogenase family protein molybdopterin-binding subunit [Desulfobacterales bacterium]|nr:xanthine dehydrogenase family protein molybdopterin-binding subunit [Desulfobacterales bacterium]